MKKLFGCNGTMIRTILIVGIILMFVAQTAVAATIKGQISDKETGDGLPAANVLIKGTSLGSAANLEGVFTIPNVPPGMYTLVISYIGYVTITADVVVPASGTVEQNVTMQPEAVEGTEVVTVTAQAAGQMQAINTQLSSKTIKNVVSAARIQELPDQSAAAALSRLPGLSLQDGDRVVVRGLQASMNAVLVNGIALPSTNMSDRGTNLGFISSNMLEGIEVTKVITPDMDANTIGGVVDLKIKEAPVGLHFDVLAQGMYNTQDRTSDNYKVWGSVSKRFLNDKLGVFIQGNGERTDGGQDQASAGYTILDSNLPYGHSPYTMNSFTFIDEQNVITNYGGSLILDYKLPAGKIVLQNTLAHTNNDMARHRIEFSFSSPIDVTYALNRDKYNMELLINALQGEYDFGPVKMQMGLAHSYSNKTTDLRYGDPGNNFGFVNSKCVMLNEAGDTLDADNFQVDDRLKMKPKDVYNIVIPETDWEMAAMNDWCVTRAEEFNQHLYNANLDFTVPLRFLSHVSGNVKFGGKMTISKRDNDADETYHRVGDSDFYNSVSDFIPGKTLIGGSESLDHLLTFSDVRNYDYKRGKYFLNSDYNYKYAFDIDLMDRFMEEVQDGWIHIPQHVARSNRDDFKGTETFTAGYLMGDFNIGPKLSFIGGGRFEHYNMDFDAKFVYVTHNVDGDSKIYDTLNTVDRNDDNFFPNAQLRYKYADWGDVRVAYTKSIIRPDFRAIIPNTFFSSGAGSLAGNTKLKPTLADNFDLSFSIFNNQIGLFTVGGFYKKMEDVFFQSAIYYQNLNLYNLSFPDSSTWAALGIQPEGMPKASDQITTYLNNPDPAYVKGLEFDWQSNFWYLPQPFNGLVLNINYSRIWSEMDYQQISNNPISEKYVDERGRIRTRTVFVTTDTIRTARLLNQGDHILNIAMGMDYKDFSGRISFNMQGDVISSIGTRPEADQYTGNVYRWDLTLQQKLPIKGFSMALNGQNIFHNIRETFQKFPNARGGKINENLFRTSYSPRQFELNLRYAY